MTCDTFSWPRIGLILALSMTSAILCVIHSFNTYLLSAYYMPGAVPGLDDTAMSQIDRNPHHWRGECAI